MCAKTPGILKWIEDTDTYLQNYLPMETLREIHFGLQASVASAPTKMKLDQVEYTQKRVVEIVDKIKQIGTMTQERFVKDEFQTLKVDFDAYHLRTLWEDEEKAKADEKRKAEAAAMIRRSSGQLFNDKLFNKDILKKLQTVMEKSMQQSLTKSMGSAIANDTTIKKLVEFYEEEMGSGMSGDSESGSGSDSDGSSDNSGSRKKSSLGAMSKVLDEQSENSETSGSGVESDKSEVKQKT